MHIDGGLEKEFMGEGISLWRALKVQLHIS